MSIYSNLKVLVVSSSFPIFLFNDTLACELLWNKLCASLFIFSLAFYQKSHSDLVSAH